MATYMELFAEAKNQEFKERCAIAALVVADGIVADGISATEQQKGWAAAAFGNPMAAGAMAAHAVLSSNRAAAIGVIQGADDATLQTAVDAAKPVLVASHIVV